jgi:tripartite-type tricarboxylate transporter receptor subunit TctC
MLWHSIARALALLTVATIVAASPAEAQYPDKPVRLVVSNAAGGFIDAVARTFANYWGPALGQNFLVENRAGAGGKIAEDYVARTAPDGYTLLVSLVLRPTLMKATVPPQFEPDIRKRFEIVGALAYSPLILAAANKLGVRTFSELIRKLRDEPGRHSFGSPGIGTPPHIIGAQLVKLFKLDVAHAPYRSGAQAVNDLIAGTISWSFVTPVTAGSLMQAGKITPIFAINRTRLAKMPNVPIVDELGGQFPDRSSIQQFRDQAAIVYLMAPRGTPLHVREKLNAVVREAENAPATRSLFNTLVLEPPPVTDGSLDDVRRLADREISAWEIAVKAIAK